MKGVLLKGRRGFTLVEVLLGLLIFSLIAMGLYGTFRGGLAVSRRVQDADRGYRELKWTLDQMAVDLENAILYDFSGSYPELSSFDGTSNYLRLMVAGEDGLKMISYRLEDPQVTRVVKTVVNRKAGRPQPDEFIQDNRQPVQRLTRTEQPLGSFFSDRNGGQPEVMCSLVRGDGLKFSYASALSSGEGGIVWRSVWDQDTLPSLIRLELTVASRDPRQDDLVVRRDFWLPLGG